MYTVYMNAERNREEIARIRKAYNTGQITREEAREQAQPIIDSINDKAKELSKKHRVRYSAISFVSMMR